MRWWRSISSIVVAAVGVSGCGAGPSVVQPDFLGELRSVDLERWSIAQSESGGSTAFATGGPDSPLRVGPATFQLADGQVVVVPPNTPGGNMCKILGYPDQPHDAPCLVAGAFSEANTAEWFTAQPFEPDGQDHFTLYVDGFEERSAIVRIGSVSVPVPVRRDATLACSEPGDLGVTPLDLPSRSSFIATLNADLEVVALDCLYSE